MEFIFSCGEEVVRFSLEGKEGKYIYADNCGTMELDIKEISPGVFSILSGDKSFFASSVRDKNRIIVTVEGYRFEFKEAESLSFRERGGEEGAARGAVEVKAPMPGKVVRVIVGEGEKVRKNQTLAIVEAMKMENEIKAAVEGIIKKIYVAEGELVDAEKPLLELEAIP